MPFVKAEKILDDAEVIKSLVVVFEQINFNKIEKNICYKTSHFLDPKAWRKMFPDRHYILPENGAFFKELVLYTKDLKVKYCEQDFISIVEVALNNEL